MQSGWEIVAAAVYGPNFNIWDSGRKFMLRQLFDKCRSKQGLADDIKSALNYPLNFGEHTQAEC